MLTDTIKLGLRVELKGNDVVIQGLDGTRVAIGKVENATDTSSKTTNRAAESTDRLASSNRSLKSTLTSLQGAIVAAGIGVLGREIFEVNKQAQSSKAALKTLTGGVEEANQAWEKIIKFAKETPFEVQQSIDAFIRLKSLGLDPSEKAMLSYANTAAAMKKDLIQFVEAVADATTGEFERLKDFGIKARTDGDTIRFIFQGVETQIKNDAAAIEGYLRSLGEVEFAGAAADQMDTLEGKSSNLSDTITDLYRTIGGLGVNDIASDVLSGLIAAVGGLNDIMPELVDTVGDLLPLLISFTAVKFLPLLFGNLKASVAGLAAALTQTTVQTNIYGQVVARTTPTMLAMAAAGNVLKTTLAFLGGPVGIAILAGTALLTFAGNAKAAEEQTADLSGEVDALTGSLVNLNRVQVEKKLADITAQIEAVTAARDRFIKEQSDLQERVRQQVVSGAISDKELYAIYQEAAKGVGEYSKNLAPLEAALKKLQKVREQILEQDLERQQRAEAEAAKALSKAQRELLETLQPLKKEEREYAESLKLLNTIYPESKRNTGEYKELIKKLQEQYKLLYPEIAKNIEAEKQREEQLKKNIKSDAELIRALEDELYLLQLTDDERSIEVNLRRLSADATAEQRAQVAELTRQIEAEEKARSQSNKAWEDFVTEMVGAFADGARSIEDVFKDLLDRLKREAINNVVRVVLGFDSKGQSGGLLGGLGQLLGLVSGGKTAGGSSGFSLGGFGGIGQLVQGKGILDFLTNGGIGGGLGNIGNSLIGLENFVSGGIQGAGNLLADLGFKSLGNSIGDFGANLLSGSAGSGLASLGLSALGGIAGNYAGAALGKGLFGKTAESNIGSTVGGVVGTLFGPLGTFLGSTFGGLLDAAFGGDGKKRVNLGVETRADYRPSTKHVYEQLQAESGLLLSAYTKRTGDEGIAAAKTLLEQFGNIDKALTDLTRAAGLEVDLAGVSLSGKASEAGHTQGNFFGSAAYNKVDQKQLEEAPAEFIKAWLQAVSQTFDAELRNVVYGLTGDAEKIMRDYQSALSINEILASGDRIFDDVSSLSETFNLLTGQFARTDETISETLLRLDLATALMGAIGEETGTTVDALLKAQSQLDAVGIQSAQHIVQTMTQIQQLQTALDADRLKDYLAGQETLWDIWQKQGDAMAYLADAAREADLPLLSAAMSEFGNTTLQVIGQIYDSKDQIAESFGSLIERIQYDLLGSEENKYNYLKAQAEALAATIATLSDPQQIIDAAKQIEQITSQAYGLLGDEQQKLMGEGVVKFLEEVNTNVQSQLDHALAQVQAENDPSTPGSAANSLQAAFERITGEMISRVAEANQRAAEAAAAQQAAADQQAAAASAFSFWVGRLPSSFNVSVTIPEVG